MKKSAVLLFLAVLLSAGTALAAGPKDLIQRIYAIHQPWAEKSLDFSEPEKLSAYFDDSLIALMRKDVDTSTAEGGVGCMDFDPLLDAQDFDEKGITPLQIQRLPNGRYEVKFTGLSEAWKGWNVRLEYDVRQTKAGWRVHDIFYKSGNSLRKILACASK